MHRSLLLGLGALLVLLVPSVAACSFAAPGPSLPARIWVWDLESEEAVDQVDLWTRGLDGDCGLVHPVDLDAGRLVYVDQAGASKGVWLRLVGEDRPPRLVFRLDGHYNDLDLDGDLLSIYMRTEQRRADAPDGIQRIDHVFTVDLSSGDATRVPIPVDWLGNPAIDDGLLHWDWVSRADYHHRFNLFDLRSGTWVHDNISLQDTFGLGERARRTALNEPWIVFADQEGLHLYERATGTLHPFPEQQEYRMVLDGDRLYTTGHRDEIQVQRLPHGAPRTLPAPEHPLFRGSVIDDGLVVLGVYSADGPSRPPSWMRDPELTQDFPIPPEWRHEGPPWYERLSGPTAFTTVLLVLGWLATHRRRPSPGRFGTTYCQTVRVPAPQAPDR